MTPFSAQIDVMFWDALWYLYGYPWLSEWFRGMTPANMAWPASTRAFPKVFQLQNSIAARGVKCLRLWTGVSENM